MIAHTPTPWTKVGSAKRTLFTTAQGQQQVEPDKAFLPVEILTCLRHAEQAQADCDFVLRACNSHAKLVEALEDAATQFEADASKLHNSVHGRKLAEKAKSYRAAIKLARGAT